MKRYNVWVLAGLLLFSVLARLPSLYFRGLDENEAISLMTVSGHADGAAPPAQLPASQLREELLRSPASFGAIAAQLLVHDRYPPLYFWITAFWGKFAGRSLESFRWVSLVSSVGLLLALWALLPPTVSPLLSGFFLLVVSFSGGAFYYSTQARPYMACMALTMLLAWLAILSDRMKHGPDWAGRYAALGAVAGLGFCTNYFMLYAALAVGLWILCGGRPWRRTILGSLTYAAVFLPFALYAARFAAVQIRSQPELAAGYSGLVADLGQVFSSLEMLTVYWKDAPRAELLPGAFLLAGLGLFFRARRAQPRLWWLAAFLFLTPLAGWMAMNGFLHKHLYRIRYLTFLLPGLWLMLGAGISSLGRRGERFAVLALSLLLALQLGAVNWGKNQIKPVYTAKPYREIAGYLKGTGLGEDTLLLVERGHERGWMAGLIYELARVTNTAVQVVPAEQSPEAFMRSARYRHFWYLSYEVLEPEKRAAFLAKMEANPGFAVERVEAWGILLSRKEKV